MQIYLSRSESFSDLYAITGFSPGSSLIVTNHSSLSLYLSQGPTPPSNRSDYANTVYPVATGSTVVVGGNGQGVWVSSDGGPITVQSVSGSINPYISTDLPHDLYTSDIEGIRRLRVDTGQTGFFDGRQFEFIKKFTSPTVYRFTSPVPFIVQFQDLTVTSGKVELFAWRADNVTPSGTWVTDPTPVHRLNEFNSDYTRQAVIASGGTIAVTNPNLYRDYIVIETSGATGQRTSVGTHQADERFHLPGTYYIQLVGTGTGGYHLAWEERPYGQ